jgi:hypothetical protein
MPPKAEPRKLRIQRWDISTLAPTATVLILGKRNTGKSVLIKHIMYHLREKVDAAVAFCPTEGSQGCYGSFIPPSMIHEEFSGPVLDNVLSTQRQQWKRGRGSHVMCVLDDCAYDKKTFSSKPLRNLFMNGRHNRVACILSVQYSLSFPTDLRANCDYVIACREQIMSNRERLYKHFFGMFSSMDSFNRCFTACTNNYEVLVLKNDSQSNRLEDCVFWWKASVDLPPFRIGPTTMWALHDSYYRDPDADGGDAGDDDDPAQRVS